MAYPTKDSDGSPNEAERQAIGEFVADTTHPHQDPNNRKIADHPHKDLANGSSSQSK